MVHTHPMLPVIASANSAYSILLFQEAVIFLGVQAIKPFAIVYFSALTLARYAVGAFPVLPALDGLKVSQR
jgi:hypothetical protein